MQNDDSRLIHPDKSDRKPRIKVDANGRVTLSKADLAKLKKELPKRIDLGESKPAVDIKSDNKAGEKADNKVQNKAEIQGDLIPILQEGAGSISVPLNGEHIVAFARYAELLREWNKVMNLTNIVDDNGIALRHFIDSLTLVNYIQNEEPNGRLSLIDVGTGAGFPGIPLRIVLPELKLTLLDSLNKRINFLNEVASDLGLDDVNTLHSRAEDAGRDKKYREKYDVATARAVASLPTLAEYCMPFVKVGGVFIAMKSHADEEVEASKKAVSLLGGDIERIEEFCLPNTDIKRTVIVIRKKRPTPMRYPRQAGKPSKEPL